MTKRLQRCDEGNPFNFDVISTSQTCFESQTLRYSVESTWKRRRLNSIASECNDHSTTSLDHSAPQSTSDDAPSSEKLGLEEGDSSMLYDGRSRDTTVWELRQTSSKEEDCKSPYIHPPTTPQDSNSGTLKHEDVTLPVVSSTPRLNLSQPQTVCYGMLRGLERVRIPEVSSCPDDVQYERGSILFRCGAPIQLSPRTVKILDSLTSVSEVTLELSCTKPDQHPIVACPPKTQRRISDHELILGVIIYGPEDVADDIGDWLESMGLHLQTPSSCKVVVPYLNPHKMTDVSNVPVMTDQLSSKTASYQNPKAFDKDALRQLYTTRSFSMAAQPVMLRTELHHHQREALTFMQQREADTTLQSGNATCGLWKHEVDAFGRERYIEVLTGQSVVRPPQLCRGGLLADEMGLGKTCTMLALIASDLATASVSRASDQGKRNPTLIVVPLALLQVWECQIRQHFVSGSVKFCTFYGPRRNCFKSFDKYDVVLTTYDTVSGEHRRSKAHPKSCLPFLTRHWHRIVLDEAHVIKNRDTDVAKAVSALTATIRWCITGTPIQNRMSDLFSLLRFLKVHPYNDFRKFDQVFLQPWKNAQTDALHKLQYLMSILAIRRPRSTIALPPKTEMVIPVVLAPQERLVYEQMKHGLVEIFDAVLDSAQDAKSYYFNALQRINDLRYVCNHGKAPKRARSSDRPLVVETSETLKQELGLLFGKDVMESPSYSQSSQTKHLKVPSLGRSASISSFSDSQVQSPDETAIDDALTPITEAGLSPCPDEALTDVSSKIIALVNDIKQTPYTDKCVIFSFWTSTLDCIVDALNLHSIPHSRYDGSMSRSRRDAVLDSFAQSTSEQNKVILVSISCGGQGLDLTAANHAYLVEPQWNPMAEEQALSRVYRLGQTRSVRLCRLVAEDTWEQRIVDLQEKKRKLAELIVDRVAVDAKASKVEARTDPRTHEHDARQLLAWLKDLVA